MSNDFTPGDRVRFSGEGTVRYIAEANGAVQVRADDGSTRVLLPADCERIRPRLPDEPGTVLWCAANHCCNVFYVLNADQRWCGCYGDPESSETIREHWNAGRLSTERPGADS